MTFDHFKAAVINGLRQFALRTKTITFSNCNEIDENSVIDCCLVSKAFSVGGFTRMQNGLMKIKMHDWECFL
jgi:hypothetical protein